MFVCYLNPPIESYNHGDEQKTLLKLIATCHQVAREATGTKTTGSTGEDALVTEPAIVGPVAAILVQRALSDEAFAKTLDGL